MANNAIMLALPEEGPQLVARVGESATDQDTKEAARTAVDRRRDGLVQDLYAPAAETRKLAAEQLVAGFRRDTTLVDRIVGEAESQPANQNGIYNSAVVLNELPGEVLRAKGEAIQRFARIAERNGARTRLLVQRLQELMAPVSGGARAE